MLYISSYFHGTAFENRLSRVQGCMNVYFKAENTCLKNKGYDH